MWNAIKGKGNEVTKDSSTETFCSSNTQLAGGLQYHGSPMKGWHDWVEAGAGARVTACQILLFPEVTGISDGNPKQTDTGKHALVHFVHQNVLENRPTELLYGEHHDCFCINENCDLVRGWAKKKTYINQSWIPNNNRCKTHNWHIKSWATQAPVIGIPDLQNDTLLKSMRSIVATSGWALWTYGTLNKMTSQTAGWGLQTKW